MSSHAFASYATNSVLVGEYEVKTAFHDTDTDIFARMSVSVLMSVSWNAALNTHIHTV